jgi:hypothetical protein
LKLCTAATGRNNISKLRACNSTYISLAERLHFSLNSGYTGTPLMMNSVIFGYWMGPDDEDGCSYVEALVQRIN